MRIAVIGWLRGKSVPPTGYGGIERMTAILTTELIRQGHNVILIAPEGSAVDGAVHLHTSDFDEAYEWICGFGVDVIHGHECWALESVVRRPLDIPFIATTHVNHAVGFTKNVVYLSQSQRTQHGLQENKDLSASPVVYVPINPALKPKGLPRQDYLLFLGMVAEQKGVIEAAQVAHLLRRKLIVAGPAWGEYADKVASMVPDVLMVGEVSDPYRSELIEQAWAMMCLHKNVNGWQEPGAGVVGESVAFNTPVAAFPNGCLSEQIVNGKNGWIVDNVDDMATFMEYAPYPNDFAPCQQAWSVENIVRQYVSLYQRVIQGESWG